MLLKIAPDLTIEQIDDVIDLALEIKLDGLGSNKHYHQPRRTQTHNSNSNYRCRRVKWLATETQKHRNCEIYL